MPDDLTRLFVRAGAHLPAGALLTLVQLAPEATKVAHGPVGTPPVCHYLDIGSLRLGAGPFRHAPPTPLELERAIALVEEAVMPLARQLASPATLVVQAPDLAPLAAGSPAGSLSIEQIETAFGQLAALAEGDPHAPRNLPTEPAFAGALLILREWMHHLGFELAWLLDGG